MSKARSLWTLCHQVKKHLSSRKGTLAKFEPQSLGFRILGFKDVFGLDLTREPFSNQSQVPLDTKVTSEMTGCLRN